MRKVLIILLILLLTFNLIACSDSSKIKDKILYNDSVKIYNMIQEHYKNKTIFTVQEREICEDYEEKYINKYQEEDLEYRVVNSLIISFSRVDMYTFNLENGDLTASEEWKKEYKKQLEILKDIFEKE